MRLRVIVNAASVNKCSLGDILELNDKVLVVTSISNRKVYLDGIPYNRKTIDKAKRLYIYNYYRGKSIVFNDQ